MSCYGKGSAESDRERKRSEVPQPRSRDPVLFLFFFPIDAVRSCAVTARDGGGVWGGLTCGKFMWLAQMSLSNC